MGTGRVTQALLTQRTLTNLQQQVRRLAKYQEQMSTGRRVNRPSDDPLDARQAISLRTRIAKNDQFLANIGAVGPLLGESDSAMQGSIDILQRVRVLTIQAANGTVNQSQLNTIALEMNQLLEELLQVGNHETNGRFIFAGTRTLTPAFSVDSRDPVTGEITSVTYQGNTDRIEVAISDLGRTFVNEPGSIAFQGTVDLFQMLIGIRDEIRAGDQNALQTTRLAELDQGVDQLLFSMARIGSIQNRLARVATRAEDSNIQLQLLMSEKIDADLAETYVNFNAEANAYQSALNAAARVLQPSLLDFIR